MSLTDADLVPERELVPGYHGRIVHSDTMTVIHWRVEAGAVLPEHSHPHEQVLTLVAGEFEAHLKGERRRLVPGQIVVIPGDMPHGGVALSDCIIVDAFHPVREEYR